MITLKSPESFVPTGHPLRAIKKQADAVLAEMSAVFDEMYAKKGRHSVPPEYLLKAMLLMALYSVRSERMFCDQLRYNMLFRWFLDMDMLDEPFNHSVFSKNRERLMEHDVARELFGRVVAHARKAGLMGSEHFTVDGTLIEAWASLKSFRKKDRANDDDDQGGSNQSVDFHGEKRTNDTHESTTDPEAKLYRKGKGKEAKLYFAAHALMENRNGLLVDLRITKATGRAEPEAAIEMLVDELPGTHQLTVGADKGYDTREFVEQCRLYDITPHVAQNTTRRRSAIDCRTTRHPGYLLSQRKRKRVEEIFGWLKTVAGFRKTRFKGRARTQLAAYFNAAAYNLLRLTRLMNAPT